MAEAFGLAASIFATIQIADRVVSICKDYVEGVRSAPADLRFILLETSTLKTILENIVFLCECDDGRSTALHGLSGASGPIAECHRTMNELEGLFPAQSGRGMKRDSSGKMKAQVALALTALAWPLKEGKARKLLQDIATIKNTIGLAIATDTAHNIRYVRQKADQIQSNLNEAQRREVLKWLESTQPSDLHHRAQRNYEPGTCDWATRLSEWRQFLDSPERQCLWIHGIPGAGKTVLAAQLIRHIEEHCEAMGSTGDYLSIYYYCYFGHNQDESTPFLKWVLAQLCRKADQVSDHLWKLFKHGGCPSREDMLTGIFHALESISVVYITIDAIDESSPREDLLKVLRDLATDPRFAKVRLLITSREYLDIEVVLNEVSTPISMRNPQLDADIELYTRSRLSKERRIRQWPQALREETFQALTKGAKGMFRWVVCQIDVLRRLKYDAAVIRQELGQLPRTINEAYDRIFRHIPEEDLLIVNTAMKWMCFEVRVGRDESIALNVLVEAVDADMQASSQRNLLHDAESLREVCGCLLTVAPLVSSHARQRLMVSFAHYTVLEYLSSDTRHQPDAFFTMETSLLVLKMSKLVFMAALNVNNNDVSESLKISDDLVPDVTALPTFGSHCAYLAIRIIKKFNNILSKDNELAALAYDLLDAEKTHWPLCEDVLHLVDVWSWDNVKDGNQAFQPEWEILPDDKIHVLVRLLLLGSLDLAEKWMQKEDLRPIFQAHVKFKYEFPPWSNDESYTERSFQGSITDCFSFIGPMDDRYESFRLLVNTGAGIFNPQSTLLSFMGVHHLVHAEHCQDWCAVERLLSLGAEPDLAGCRVTILQIAVATLDIDGTITLLEAGADPNAQGCPAAPPLPETHELPVFNCLSGMSPLRICRREDPRIECLDSSLLIMRSNSDHDAQSIIETMLLQYGAEE